MTTTDLALGIVIGTLLLVLLIGTVLLMLVRNNSRRNHYRAELAELQLAHANELMAAEREAVQQTLQDVGKELHDNVSQLLMVIHIGLNWSLNKEPPDPRLDPAREALADCINEVRSLGHALNMDLWTANSFQEAILRLADRLGRTGRWAVKVVQDKEPIQLPNDTSAILFRVCQEIVANAMKHSEANTITISLQSAPPLVTITDDGMGFNTATVVENAGLRNIRRRCALIHFEADCTTSPNQGCTWRLRQLP